MAKKPSIPPRQQNSVQKVVTEAAALDRRRQNQIANQIGAINRVLAAWKANEAWQYDDEMQKLHEQLAAAQVRAEECVEALTRLLKAYDEDPETLEATADDVRELLHTHTTPATPAGENEEDDNG